jgi:hypothetical protein
MEELLDDGADTGCCLRFGCSRQVAAFFYHCAWGGRCATVAGTFSCNLLVVSREAGGTVV